MREHERLLTGGFYAEIQLAYDATVAQEKGGRPFGIAALRPIQLSTRERAALQTWARGSAAPDGSITTSPQNRPGDKRSN